MPINDRVQIQLLLENMRRSASAEARLSATRELFAQLNYDPVRKPLAVHLADEIKKQLASSPTIIATACNDQSFLIIHVQLASETLPRMTERAVVSAMLKDHPYALFVFSNKDHSRWHLLNVKVARKEVSEENRDTKLRRLHRRISIAPEDRLRTAIERIEKLDVALINPELFGISPLAVQEAHDDAFDVEAVTRQFFQEYKRVFEFVEDAITGIRGPDKRRLFTQRLFNRLMFIAFIQRKGWLKFAGMEDNEYIEAIWKDYLNKKKDDSNFYTDRLEHLFFRGLNNSSHVDMLATNRGRSAPDSFLQRRIGDVPYLNGGLFEKSDDGTDEADAGIMIPDKAINTVLHELFARFNFTVTESTPLDVEVAVDPEMLGKVFEELVTGRHESGSYYTPKPIVSFMCREALKGYLEAKCAKERAESIARFVDEHDASGISDGEAVLDALKAVKCCDPACGSGAYLLGMMHELLDLRQTLFRTNKKLDPVNVYQRKLEIIQTNVYGVDLDPFAINIARLRLWLSLAVDFEGEAPPPLPNLDFKIECGDSLAAPDPSGGFDPGFQASMVDDFLSLKREFLTSHSQRKKELWKQIKSLREKIMAWTGFQPPPGVFHWQVEFAEAFIDGGFDVVLANPPYVRMELIKPQKPLLRRNFPAVHAERADLYCYFYARALQLLKPCGIISFISSNKWLRAGYGSNLRRYLAGHCQIHVIVDFGDLPVFEASAYPMIFVAAKGKASVQAPVIARVNSLDAPYPDIRALLSNTGSRPQEGAIAGANWLLSDSTAAGKISVMGKNARLLSEVLDGEIFYGIKTGLNEAFVIDAEIRAALLSESKGVKRIIKRFVRGKDIRRWTVDNEDVFLLFMPHGVDTDGLSPVLKHLRKFKDDLESRATKQGWYELQQPQERYAARFNSPKIVFPDIAKEPRFALDSDGAYVDCTGFALPTADLFLLGVLNSRSVRDYFLEVGAQVRGGYLRFKRQYVERVPIPIASSDAREAIISLVKRCLDAKGLGCEQWEKEIDKQVAALYGL